MGSIENFLISEFIMQTESTGSVRVDLVGGTLDLPPIHLILDETVTLNLATSLKAKVIFESID